MKLPFDALKQVSGEARDLKRRRALASVKTVG
jgi:hypothetical protein